MSLSPALSARQGCRPTSPRCDAGALHAAPLDRPGVAPSGRERRASIQAGAFRRRRGDRRPISRGAWRRSRWHRTAARGQRARRSARVGPGRCRAIASWWAFSRFADGLPRPSAAHRVRPPPPPRPPLWGCPCVSSRERSDSSRLMRRMSWSKRLASASVMLAVCSLRRAAFSAEACCAAMPGDAAQSSG